MWEDGQDPDNKNAEGEDADKATSNSPTEMKPRHNLITLVLGIYFTSWQFAHSSCQHLKSLARDAIYIHSHASTMGSNTLFCLEYTCTHRYNLKKTHTKQSNNSKSCKGKSLVNSYRQKHQNNKFVTSTPKSQENKEKYILNLGSKYLSVKSSFPCPKPTKQTIKPTTTWRSKNISRRSWLSS